MYICHHTFDGKAITGNHTYIKVGTRLPIIAGYVSYNNSAVCLITSYSSHQHFAIDDDNNGLERGNLTYEIAFAPREREHDDGYIYRFSQSELDMLCKDYPHWLKQQEPLLFNHEFFQADINELKILAKKLGIN